MKRCKRCRENLPTGSFWPCCRTPDHRNPYCKPCLPLQKREEAEKRAADRDAKAAASAARRQRLAEERKAAAALLHDCTTCGGFHSPAQRHEVLRRMLPATVVEIREAWHFWGKSPGKRNRAEDSGGKRLNRDLHAIGAYRVGDVWTLDGNLLAGLEVAA